jgi:hypothetical protein
MWTGAAARQGVGVVIFDACSALGGPAVLRLSSCCGTEGIEFSVQSSLRLDEAATVIAHGLVTSVWVLCEDCIEGCDKNDDQQDQ